MPMTLARFLATAILLFATGLTAFARGRDGNDRAAFGRDITISEGQSAGDIACAFCTVHVEGDVTGDVAVFWGSVNVAPGHSISGDAALAGGDLNLAEGAAVHGDVAIVGGQANVSEGAVIHGDRAVIPPPLGTLILFGPLIFMVLLIGLIAYFIRRNRYRFPRYPQGYGVPPQRR